MEYTIKAERFIKITDENIDDIMCNALEGGICYWCGEAIVKENYLGEYASDQISRGGSLILKDVESEEEYELTKDKFLLGFKKAVEQGYLDEITEDGQIDFVDIDADISDCIIQLALFDEIVFG